MTSSASGGPMSDEQIETAVRRAHDLLSFYEKRPLDPWVNQRAPLMCDYVIALAAELASCGAVLTQRSETLRLALRDDEKAGCECRECRLSRFARAALEAPRDAT